MPDPSRSDCVTHFAWKVECPTASFNACARCRAWHRGGDDCFRWVCSERIFRSGDWKETLPTCTPRLMEHGNTTGGSCRGVGAGNADSRFAPGILGVDRVGGSISVFGLFSCFLTGTRFWIVDGWRFTQRRHNQRRFRHTRFRERRLKKCFAKQLGYSRMRRILMPVSASCFAPTRTYSDAAVGRGECDDH